jgi:flagellar hook-associated protein 3 FlgL
MRIADNMMYDQVRGNVAKNRSEMAELQNQAATQKRVTKPSDDPVSAARVLGARVDLHGNKQYLKNLEYAKSFLDYTDQTLGDVTDNLVRAKELAIAQAGDAGANQETRQVTAAEIEQIFNQVVAMGNRKLGDRFIFGGFRTTTQPFDHEGAYSGDDGEMLIHTDKGQFMPMNIPGVRVFHGEGLNEDGNVKPSLPQATTIEELQKQQVEQKQRLEHERAHEPETQQDERAAGGVSPAPMPPSGANVFRVLRDVQVALTTNDKVGVQDALEELDKAISQVVLARAQVGSRVTALNNLAESLQKSKVESQLAISNNEDADVFEVVSNINKNESTLQATLETTGKLVQKSLLDFLR